MDRSNTKNALKFTGRKRVRFLKVIKEKIDWIDEFSEWPASTERVSQEEKCTDRTVRNWAEENSIRKIGGGKRGQYLLFRHDVINFRQRPRPGRRWSDRE